MPNDLDLLRFADESGQVVGGIKARHCPIHARGLPQGSNEVLLRPVLREPYLRLYKPSRGQETLLLRLGLFSVVLVWVTPMEHTIQAVLKRVSVGAGG